MGRFPSMWGLRFCRPFRRGCCRFRAIRAFVGGIVDLKSWVLGACGVGASCGQLVCFGGICTGSLGPRAVVWEYRV